MYHPGLHLFPQDHEPSAQAPFAQPEVVLVSNCTWLAAAASFGMDSDLQDLDE